MTTKPLTRWLPLLFLALMVFLALACAPKQYHTAVVADETLYQLLNAVHAGEQTTLCGQVSCAGVLARPAGAAWNDAKSQAFNRQFLPVVEAGRQYNLVLATIKPGVPVPQAAATLINGIAASLKAIADDYPEGPSKSKILAEIGQVQSIVLQAIAIILTVK